MRAIGFGSTAVVCSVLAEAAALAAAGGAIGALTAWLLFDGYAVSTLNFQSMSQVAFAFAVTPALVAQAWPTPSALVSSARCGQPGARRACPSWPR